MKKIIYTPEQALQFTGQMKPVPDIVEENKESVTQETPETPEAISFYQWMLTNRQRFTDTMSLAALEFIYEQFKKEGN